ncbi:hypothetical protein [Cetobacterium sp.]
MQEDLKGKLTKKALDELLDLLILGLEYEKLENKQNGKVAGVKSTNTRV